MKVIITRKRDIHTYTGVKKIIVEKKGLLFSSMDVHVSFKEGATSHYIGGGRDMLWDINPESIPEAGSYGCEKIEILEENDSLLPTVKKEDK